MTDIAIRLDPTALDFDAFFDGEDLATETGLGTAVLMSLGTDRRANDDDVLPDRGTDRRGWWGDAFPAVEGDKIGSRLWLLRRRKLTTETLKLARDYALEALQWLIDDGIAGSVAVEIERQDPVRGNILVTITRPTGEVHRYDYLWSTDDAL